MHIPFVPPAYDTLAVFLLTLGLVHLVLIGAWALLMGTLSLVSRGRPLYVYLTATIGHYLFVSLLVLLIADAASADASVPQWVHVAIGMAMIYIVIAPWLTEEYSSIVREETVVTVSLFNTGIALLFLWLTLFAASQSFGPFFVHPVIGQGLELLRWILEIRILGAVAGAVGFILVVPNVIRSIYATIDLIEHMAVPPLQKSR